MLRSASIATLYFAVALCCAALRLHPFTLLLLPPLVAAAWALGDRRGTLLLLALAGVAGALGTGLWATAVMYALVASLGIVIGTGFRRRWSFGRCATAAAAGGFMICAASLLWQWDAIRQFGRAWLAGQVRDLESVQADSALSDARIEAMQWLSRNWDHLTLGMLFGGVLVCMCIVVAGTARLIRKAGGDARLGPRGQFRHFRPPEWLVWAAILLAGLWFVEQRWPHEALRAVTWNSAIALFSVYWLNGLSCLVFALTALKMHPFALFAVLFVVLTLEVPAIVATFGLFDTWWDFRRKLERLAAARRLREREGE